MRFLGKIFIFLFPLNIFSSLNQMSSKNIDFNENESSEIYNKENNNDVHHPHNSGVIGTTSYSQSGNYEYYSWTSFNMKTYFENLSAYQPYNSLGSCAFVSLVSMLSYLDTFVNDNFVPNAYEFKDVNAQTEAEAKSISPGTKRDSYNASIFNSYYEYCHATMNDNLQSKLTVINNVIFNRDNVNDFYPSTIGTDYQGIMNNYLQNSGLSLSITANNNSTTEQYINTIKSHIDNNQPVVTEIKKYNSQGQEIGYHSVVAYDYDEDYIYANFGWSSYSTHIPLLGGVAGYSKITAIYIFNYSNNVHVHSGNYVVNGIEHCGCNLIDKVLFFNEHLYSNVAPTIYWMRDQGDLNETYDLYMYLDYDDEYHFLNFTYVSFNRYTFSEDEWAYFLLYGSNSPFTFVLRRHNSLNCVEYETHYEKLLENCVNFTKTSTAFGFPDAYCYSPVQTSHGVYDIHFTVNRLRCGYIHNEFIVLSPYRNGAGIAYLEFVFEDLINKFEIDMAFWSDGELTNYVNATGYIQYLGFDGDYHNLVDLFNDISLSETRFSMDHLLFVFPEPTNCFRIYLTAPAQGNRNKGRIAVDNIRIYGENFYQY